LLWRIIEEVPQVEEAVDWHASTRVVLQVKEARDFTAKRNSVASVNLRGHILEGVSPLVQNAADVRPKELMLVLPVVPNYLWEIRPEPAGWTQLVVPAQTGGIGRGLR